MTESLERLGYHVAETSREYHRLSVLRGPIGNPNRVPSKKRGRRGTRRAWKRAHPPGAMLKYFEVFDARVR